LVEFGGKVMGVDKSLKCLSWIQSADDRIGLDAATALARISAHLIEVSGVVDPQRSRLGNVFPLRASATVNQRGPLKLRHHCPKPLGTLRVFARLVVEKSRIVIKQGHAVGSIGTRCVFGRIPPIGVISECTSVDKL